MKFISAVMVAIISGLLLAFSAPFISRAVNPDRISAEFYPGAWYPYPLGKEGWAKRFRDEFESESYANGLIDRDELRFAKILLYNGGNKTVNNIKLKLGRVNKGSGILVSKGAEQKFELENELSIPDMAPGDRAVIYTWSIFDLSDHFEYDEIETHSSEGPFSIRYYDHKSNAFRAGSDFPWLGAFVFLCLAIVSVYVIACVVMANILSKYVKNLLSDEDVYIDERVKFTADPEKFLIKPLR